MDFDVLAHGAIGDGLSHDTAAIQAAIDAAHAAGGGRVVLPGGHTYLAGSVQLRSGVELHLAATATLANCEHWEHITARGRVGALSAGVIAEHTAESGSFVWATDAHDIALTGHGTIDGGGRHYVIEDLGEIYRMPNERPFCLFLQGCRNVTLRDLAFRDSALWTVRLTGCEDVVVDALTITGDPKVPNADGLDIDSCRRVRVSNCRIETPDDAISIKTCEEFDAGPSEDIVITNCVLQSRSSACVVGVDARAPIRNVVVSGCVIRPSHRGLAVNMGQASHYENIIFSDCIVETVLDDDAWWGCGEPIYVSAAPWHDQVGTIRGVVFDTIRCRGENSVFIDAVEPGLVSDITLRNVQVEIVHGSGRPGGRHDRRPWSVPKTQDDTPGAAGDRAIYPHPTHGIVANNVDGLLIDGCRVSWQGTAEHFGQAIELTNNTDVEIRAFRGSDSPKG